MKVEHEKSGVKCYLRIGAVCRMGATFKEADELEHKVKAAIMEKRGKPANSREQVYDTEPVERYLVKEEQILPKDDVTITSATPEPVPVPLAEPAPLSPPAAVDVQAVTVSAGARSVRVDLRG